MLRVIPLLSALVLLLSSPSQAAFVSATPASLPPATSENASTAFFEGGSESRIGLLCHNDPVNRSDPTGLDPERDFIAGVGDALTFGQAEKVAEFFYPGYIASIDKSSAAYRLAGPIGLAVGMADGTGEAGAAKAAAGKLLGSTSKVMAKVEKQLAEHGEKSLQKSLNSFEKRIAEHTEKIGEAKAAGGNTSSMEREMRAFEKERDAIKEVLKKKNE